jgi:hypothetical protein
LDVLGKTRLFTYEEWESEYIVVPGDMKWRNILLAVVNFLFGMGKNIHFLERLDLIPKIHMFVLKFLR